VERQKVKATDTVVERTVITACDTQVVAHRVGDASETSKRTKKGTLKQKRRPLIFPSRLTDFGWELDPAFSFTGLMVV